MKQLSRSTILWMALLMSLPGPERLVQAQELPSATDQFVLPPLALLQSVAVENSPLLRREEAAMKKFASERTRAGKEWMRGVTLEGTSQYGSYGDNTANQLFLGNRAAMTVKVSLYDLLATGNAKDRYAYEEEEVRFQRAALEKELRQAVIARYSALSLAHRLVALTSEGNQMAQSHRLLAEREFKNGEIPLSEFSRVGQIATEAAAKFENARAQYTEAYAQLEELIGTDLHSLGARQ